MTMKEMNVHLALNVKVVRMTRGIVYVLRQDLRLILTLGLPVNVSRSRLIDASSLP